LCRSDEYHGHFRGTTGRLFVLENWILSSRLRLSSISNGLGQRQGHLNRAGDRNRQPATTGFNVQTHGPLLFDISGATIYFGRRKFTAAVEVLGTKEPLTEGPAKNHLAGRAERILVRARIVLWETFEVANMLHSWLPRSLQVVPKNLTAAGRKPSWLEANIIPKMIWGIPGQNTSLPNRCYREVHKREQIRSSRHRRVNREHARILDHLSRGLLATWMCGSGGKQDRTVQQPQWTPITRLWLKLQDIREQPQTQSMLRLPC